MSERALGIYRAVCVGIEEKSYGTHAKVRLPWLSYEDEETIVWARIAAVSAFGETPKDGFGIYWTPEVGDSVFVVFEEGDVSRPIILGAAWDDGTAHADNYPPEKKDESNPNDVSLLRSQSGHVLQFSEGDEPAVTLRDCSGETVVGCGNFKAEVKSGQNNAGIPVAKAADSSGVGVFTSSGDIRLQALGKVAISAKEIHVSTNGNVEVVSPTQTEVSGTSAVNLDAPSATLQAGQVAVGG